MKSKESICNLDREYVEEYLKMPTDDRISWAVGKILIGIGEGKVRDAAYHVTWRAFAAGVLSKKLRR